MTQRSGFLGRTLPKHKQQQQHQQASVNWAAPSGEGGLRAQKGRNVAVAMVSENVGDGRGDGVPRRSSVVIGRLGFDRF